MSGEHKRLVEQFARIAFSSEFGPSAERGYMVRWTAPVRVAIDGFFVAGATAEIMQRIDTLAAITGHDINLVAPGETANVTVRFTEAATVALIAGGAAPCYTKAVLRGGTVVWAEISIVPDDPTIVAHCLSEELAQAMGLLDDSPLIDGSLFNDASQRPDLSYSDAVMLRTLYDPRLRPGMGREAALEVARRVIGEILAARLRNAS